MKEPQTYANHVRRPVAYYIAATCATAGFGLLVVDLVRRPTLAAAALALIAWAVLMLLSIQRLNDLRLQDRIIRLEMRLRLARLGLEADLARLSRRQVVALRFAADDELPALIQRAVAEQLTGAQIKQAIRTWQPDYHRV